jgi:hypothetical protein
MEWISRAVDKLPTWAKAILLVLAILGTVDGIARHGFFPFMLRVIFSP